LWCRCQELAIVRRIRHSRSRVSYTNDSAFHLRLTHRESQVLTRSFWQDGDEIDSVTEIIMFLCNSLAGWAVFEVRGFGQASWPVNVATDLAVVLEQLPVVIRGLRQRQECTLDFYEQSVQRQVNFLPAEEQVRLQCLSGTDWTPVPTEVVQSRAELLMELRELRDSFLELVSRRAPAYTNDGNLLNWAGASE